MSVLQAELVTRSCLREIACYSMRFGREETRGRTDDGKANLTGVDRRNLSVLTAHKDQSKTVRRRTASIFVRRCQNGQYTNRRRSGPADVYVDRAWNCCERTCCRRRRVAGRRLSASKRLQPAQKFAEVVQKYRIYSHTVPNKHILSSCVAKFKVK